MTPPTPAPAPLESTDDPFWYKDAVIYELHIRAFKDANGDGIGDLPGLIEQLDYLVDLGATAIWLLPFYPSPLRDGGYDIADYTGVHEHYGTRADVARLLREAHQRGLRVITELVLNHTSAEHPWFQRARQAPAGSPHRAWYVWSDTPKRYADARIIFQDFETSNWSWDPVANAYYWHRFYAHQPDLNFENPDVQAALFEVIDFWMELGVDGMRLDAVPYLFEREGTSCENLPETHAFLKQLRAHIDAKFPNRMLLAEANQWPSDAAAYFGDGDECHMNFHFPLMPRMFMAIQQEDSFPIVNIIKRTPAIPESCQWATFLRNHDELTLEMVTDEDRDSMIRAYASERHARINLGIRRRLMPLLTVRRKVELMNALLLSLPGTPVIYYGDEIGMGDNIYLGDRNGVRTPMQWSGDRNGGFSRANPQKLYLPTIIDPEFHYEAINVEAQQANPSSLLWWMKHLIAKRKEHRVFGRGTIEFVTSDNPRILGFVRAYDGERVLVLANLSRFVQCARFDLRQLAGTVPVEMFGRMRFPEVTDAPYFVSLGPHGFYWLSLEPAAPAALDAGAPTLACRAGWAEVLAAPRRAELARVLTTYARARRWFRSKSRTVKHTAITDVVPTGDGHALVLLQFEYQHGASETYAIPVAFVPDAPDSARPVVGVIAAVTIGSAGDGGTLVDAVVSEAFAAAPLALMRDQATIAGGHGALVGEAFPSLAALAPDVELGPRLVTAEQSNSAIIYGGRYLLKLFRVAAEGPSTEDELGRFLHRRDARGVARLAGALEYRRAGQESTTIGVLFDFVPNQGDAWQLALDALDRCFDRLLADGARPEAPEPLAPTLLARAAVAPTAQVAEWVGPFLDRARLLGQRTAELHQVLASEPSDPLFAPQPFDIMHQQSLYQGASGLMARTYEVLRAQLTQLPDETRALAERALAREADTDRALARITARKLDVTRIRVHGDYHLGQVLWTGDDFVIIDFEGEPARPLSQRRFKRCPLRDVAGMVRSFHYAGEAARRDGRVRPQDAPVLAPWAQAWPEWVSAAFLGGYLEVLAGSALLPASPGDVAMLLDFYLLEKCIYEIGYELDNRPAWVEIPLRGLLALTEDAR
ncbi:MAG: maltose alpha-D-glucosyltransferase [Myxococcales bacterium]|nr:maltose alpha-D-glucosyltransferase [Myxococcales bacterium]